MTVGYLLHIMPLWAVLSSMALLVWATHLASQLFTTWRWATELRRWKPRDGTRLPPHSHATIFNLKNNPWPTDNCS